MTQTKLNGQTIIRIGLGNVLTTEEHLPRLGTDPRNGLSLAGRPRSPIPPADHE